MQIQFNENTLQWSIKYVMKLRETIILMTFINFFSMIVYHSYRLNVHIIWLYFAEYEKNIYKVRILRLKNFSIDSLGDLNKQFLKNIF